MKHYWSGDKRDKFTLCGKIASRSKTTIISSKVNCPKCGRAAIAIVHSFQGMTPDR